MSVETWYVLDDGSYGDPLDVSPGKDGMLQHKDGRKVAYAEHGPRTRSVDPDEERGKAKVKPKAREAEAKPKDEPPKSDRQMKAEGGHGYKTR